MRVKICGLTQREDVELAVENHPWALGFNFYPASPRFLKDKYYHTFFAMIPAHIKKIGIYIEASSEQIMRVLDEGWFDYVQVYKNYTVPTYYKKRMIMALPIATFQELPSYAILKNYGFVLLDAPKNGASWGGNGMLANWKLAQVLATEYQLILAGGLNPSNIQTAMEIVQPFAIDVASGIETKPGFKNKLLLETFMEISKNYD